MRECYCGSKKNYEECCKPIIEGKRAAETPEELMRARYSAFAAHEIDFLMESTVQNQSDNMSRKEVERWSEKSDWKRLEIIKTAGGNGGEDSGNVEFKAYYAVNGTIQCHHENAKFKKMAGKWLFEDGEPVAPEQIKRETPKIGRNDLCPCGSGKKYKKCCGKN